METGLKEKHACCELTFPVFISEGFKEDGLVAV